MNEHIFVMTKCRKKFVNVVIPSNRHQLCITAKNSNAINFCNNSRPSPFIEIIQRDIEQKIHLEYVTNTNTSTLKVR